MVVCKECSGNFDNGELIGGICRECAEEERHRQIRASAVARMMNSQSYQTEMELDGNTMIRLKGGGLDVASS